MSDPSSQTDETVETVALDDADSDILELGDVRDTKGKPGIFGDGQGGLFFP